ncbi:MAG: phosphoglycerate dehydrogenase [Deltaproteobacteria bacterium]|nr:phosphoglycerate dehydrogenase [Deltaproteobacteria bacterium]MBW2067955.1 phosphoglycerate dehydrogenase [Deltaproteobacteria bacterium]
MYRILISDPLAEAGVEKLKGVPEFEVEVNTSLTPEELKEVVKEFDALVIRSATKVTSDVVNAGERLKVIARAGIGLDNVDIEAATRKGVVVMNTPEGNVITTAEHTIAMILAVSRNIPQANASLKSGKWEKKKFRGKEVFNKVLGIIGVGRIGRVVADRAKGLKMQVIAYDPYISPDAVEKLGIEAVDFDELLSRSDYITVHTPLTQETRNLINKDTFKKVKRGVFIINCARGGIVNEEDLAEAIKDGTVAGAAVDVFTSEPPPADHPLLQLDKVVVTPHLGASTEEAQENVAIAVADQVIDYLLRGTIRNAINAPTIDGEVLANLRPYLVLSEKLGNLLSQITKGAPKEINIEYVGDVTELDRQPLTISVVKGLLSTYMKDDVNFVNAIALAKERNIGIRETTRKETEDFTNLIIVQLKTSDDENTVAGTIFGKHDARLVRINDFRLEAEMEGNLLLIYNIDTPGTIGAIGTCLGKHNINISMMDVGQVLEKGQNIILLRTDTPVPDHVIDELLQLKNVEVVQRLRL